MPPTSLPASILLALGLAAAETGENGDTGDTGDTGETTDTAGPCLSVQTCLCTHVDALSAGVWTGLAVVAAAGRRRREGEEVAREEAIEQVLSSDVLPPDVVARLRDQDGDGS